MASISSEAAFADFSASSILAVASSDALVSSSIAALLPSACFQDIYPNAAAPAIANAKTISNTVRFIGSLSLREQGTAALIPLI